MMQRSWRSVLILPFLLSLAAAAAGQSFILSGRVVTETGEPVPRATVELTESRGGYGMALRWLDGQEHPETIAHATSGEDGWYWLEVPQEGLWRVVARAPGYVAMERFLEPYIGDERLATVALARDVGLPVTVVNADGRPVPRARVWNQPVPREDRWQGARRSGWFPAFATLLTDDQGRLSLPRAAGESLRVKAWSWGLLASEEATSEGEPVRLVLRRGVERPVEVVDTRGRPVSAAILRWGLGWTAGITDEDGRAVLTFPATGATAVSASTQDGRWVSTEVVQPPPEGSAPRVRLELPEPTAVRGRVVDETGEPVSGALVFRDRVPPAVTTGGDGSYDLRFTHGTGSDPVALLSAAAPGYRFGRRQVDLASREPTGHFSLERSRPLSGRVVREDGSPIVGAKVWRVPQPEWQFMRGGVYQPARDAIETDSRGGFLFVDAPRDRRVLVAALAGGYAPVSVSVAPHQPAEGLVLELTTGSSLTGRVVGSSGVPLAAARVVLTAEPEEGPLRPWSLVSTDERAGEYQLSVYLDPGYYEARELTLVTDEELVLDLHPARVTGRLISPGGEPVAGGQVLLVQEGLEGARRATPQATTGPDGSFEMPGVAEGAYRLSAHHGGASVVRSVQVAGRETDLGEIWLSAGRELTLLPRLSGGGAPQRLAVLFLDAGDRLLVPVEAAVGPDGLAHVRGVPEEAHTAVVMAQEPSPEAVAQLPVPGSLPPEAPPIPVVLEQMGTLSIHLPEDVDGATLTLVDAAGRPPLMLRLSGVASVPLGREHQELPVEPGTWTLTATASDGRAWSAQARVTPAQTTEVRLGTP